MADLWELTLTELAAKLAARELSPVEATRALLERIEQLNPRLHPYALVTADHALEAARRAEDEIGRGELRGPLHGVPIAVKDLCAMRGVPTACGTRVLADWRPDHDAAVVERLEAAGAVILGKLQLTEGAYGWHHPEVTLPVNPWNPGRWTGVSSSGSGVATAAGLCFGSLGSDTGGSIRFPSFCCGLVGIKPTYGRVSRFGVFPLAHSLDHIGPMTRRVADAAAMLGAIAGHDARDPTSLLAAVPDYGEDLDGGVRGLRVGVDRAYNEQGVEAVVSGVIVRAIEKLSALGAEIVEIEMPSVEALERGWALVTATEAAIAHTETFPKQADAYGPQLRGLLELGQRVSGTDYARVELERHTFSAALARVFEDVDVIAAPSLSVPPPPVAQTRESGATEGIENARGTLHFTAPFDFSGSPTISLPGGFTDDGLPLGFQLIGRHLDEALLCRAGHAYESATEWHLRRPPL